jgi:hypothetical protein
MLLAVSLWLFSLAQGPDAIEALAAANAQSVTSNPSSEPSDSRPAGAIAIADVAAATPDPAPAQKGNDGEDKKPETPPHTGIIALLDGLRLDITHLPSRPNLYIAMAGGGLALAVHPADRQFNIRLRSHYDLVNDVFAPAKYYGDTPEQVVLSLGTYAYGRIFDEPKVSHLGMDLLRAQAISELLVQPLKFATRRERPDGSNDLSFPSGHAAATFAAATVIERHLGWKGAVFGYAIASYVAASRLHDNVHYLSDVVFGAAVGTIAGRTVTEHGRETWTFAPTFLPGGAALVVMRQP